jgi:hypothetical protein
MTDQVVQDFVLDVGLEMKLVFQSNRICHTEGDERYFRKQMVFALFAY